MEKPKEQSQYSHPPFTLNSPWKPCFSGSFHLWYQRDGTNGPIHSENFSSWLYLAFYPHRSHDHIPVLSLDYIPPKTPSSPIIPLYPTISHNFPSHHLPFRPILSHHIQLFYPSRSHHRGELIVSPEMSGLFQQLRIPLQLITGVLESQAILTHRLARGRLGNTTKFP